MEPAGEAARRILAAFKKIRVQPVAVGEAAEQAWGSTRPARGLDLLSPTGERQRVSLLNAARADGFQVEDGNGGSLRLRLGSAHVRILEASTPFHRRVLSRAQPGVVLGTRLLLARLEDVVLLRAASGAAGAREILVELLRRHAGKFDGPYLKEQGDAAGTFALIRDAWTEAKKQ